MAVITDFLIVGAGVIGVSVARGLRRRGRGKVLVIDKESRPAQHASGRNSGVLHAGVYYGANSLKARFCVEGNRRMREYCTLKKIPINCSGKVIVATRPDLPPSRRSRSYVRSGSKTRRGRWLGRSTPGGRSVQGDA